jgi:hypothetical protein
MVMAQGKGEIQLHVAPHGSMEYVLDGKERLSNRALVLPAGEHRFTFWAPDRSIVDTTLLILADTSIAFYKTLAPSPEFVAFQQQQRKVRRARTSLRILPLAATLVSGVFTAVAYNAYSESRTLLQDAEASYTTLRDPNAITLLKEKELPRLQTEHDAAARRVGWLTAITSVAALGTVWSFIKAAQVDDAPYEDKERIRFEGLVWLPGSTGGHLYAGFTIPLSR